MVPYRLHTPAIMAESIYKTQMFLADEMISIASAIGKQERPFVNLKYDVFNFQIFCLL